MEFTVELYETAVGQPVVQGEILEIKRKTPALYALVVAGLSKLRNSDYHGPAFLAPA